MDDFGKRLKEIRNKRGFPQKLVANALNLQRSNYSKIENNLQKMNHEQIKLFCDFCNVSADYLLNTKVNGSKTLNQTTLEDLNKALQHITKLLND